VRPRRSRGFLPLPMNHRITFPSVHSMGGTPFVAEVSAPTHDLAVREVLEHCARESIALEYLHLHNIQDLRGARLDGLKLSNCKLTSVDLSGASLVGARVEHTRMLKVAANSATTFDRAWLEDVQLEECALNGWSMRDAVCSGLRLEGTTARGWRVDRTNFDGVRFISLRGSTRDNTPAAPCDLTGWHMHMALLRSFQDADEVIAASALTDNEKAAVRTLAVTGSREAAAHYLRGLEAMCAT